jgi:hypothetical protein
MEISNIFKKLNLRRNGTFLGIGTNAESDWKVIFLSSLFLFVIVVILSTYLFIDINTGVATKDDEIAKSRDKSLNTALLTKVVEYYEGKQQNFDKIKSTKATVSDPSI